MKTMIGAYGDWAASLLSDKPGPLSLQNCPREEFAARRAKAKARVLECMAPPALGKVAAPTVQWRREYGGLSIEALTWQLPGGAATEGWVLKPVGATGRLPAVLALHDHGGFKYLGKEKIAQAGGLHGVRPSIAIFCPHRPDCAASLRERADNGQCRVCRDTCVAPAK